MARSARIDVQEGVPELAGAHFTRRDLLADDFGEENIQILFSIGCDTARAVLELSADEIMSRTNNEIDEALARKIIEVIAYEFED